MCFSYTRESRALNPIQLSTLDDASLDSIITVARSTNPGFAARAIIVSAQRARSPLEGSRRDCHDFGSNGFSWNYFIVDDGLAAADLEIPSLGWGWGSRPNPEILGNAFATDG